MFAIFLVCIVYQNQIGITIIVTVINHAIQLFIMKADFQVM